MVDFSNLPLPEYIRRHFSGTPFTQTASDFEFEFDQTARAAAPWAKHNPFFMDPGILRDRVGRADFREDYATRMGMLQRLEGYSEGAAFRTRGFRMVRPPGEMTPGYGFFALPRSTFTGLNPVTPEQLAYMDKSFSYDRRERGVQRFTLSGKTARPRIYEAAAEHMNEIKSGSTRYASATRAILDIETAGLGNQGAWQISVRLMQGDRLKRNVNVLIDNPMMDMGAWMGEDGRPTSFKQFYEALRGPQEWSADFRSGMGKVLGTLNEADFFVAHNAAFDMSQLAAEIQRVGMDKGTDPVAMAARDFVTKSVGKDVVDTRLMAMAILGEKISIAPELAAKDIFQPMKMENLLMQTSFFEDVESRITGRIAGMDTTTFEDLTKGYVSQETLNITDDAQRYKSIAREAVRNRVQAGLHGADVDIFFTGELERMIYNVLRGDKNLLKYRAMTDKQMRQWISESGALTPVTKMGPYNATPLEMMSMYSRGQAKIANVMKMDPETLMLQSGDMKRFVDQNIGADGNILNRVRLNSNQPLQTVQENLTRYGKPFNELSPFERIFNTMVGRYSNADITPGGIASLRNRIGDITGSGLVRGAELFDIKGGKNVLLPMEIIRMAEDQGVLGTNISGVKGIDKLQAARWSPFDYGGGRFDMALVGDIFQNEEDVGKFNRFLRQLADDDPELAKRLGLTGRVDEITSTLAQHGRKFGVQLGILSGTGAESQTRLSQMAQFLMQNGFESDRKNMEMMTYLIHNTPELDKILGEGFIKTGASMINIDRLPGAAGRLEDARVGVGATRELLETMPKVLQDKNFLRALEIGQAIPSKTPARVYETLTKAAKRAPMAAAAAGTAAVLGIMWKRKQNREKHQYVMEQQPFEDNQSYYHHYKEQMGEFVPSGELVAMSSPRNQLQTAGLVQSLDYNKIGHHNMGNDRYARLYGG